MTSDSPIHPHDRHLPTAVIRKRRRFRRIAYIMLVVAVLTAAPGWILYGVAIWNVFTLRHFTFLQTITAYGLLIISSVALVLGLLYLLLAQARRMSLTVDGGADGFDGQTNPRCGNCGWPHDYPDRFCRHCGKALAGVSNADGEATPTGPQRP